MGALLSALSRDLPITGVLKKDPPDLFSRPPAQGGAHCVALRTAWRLPPCRLVSCRIIEKAPAESDGAALNNRKENPRTAGKQVSGKLNTIQMQLKKHR